MKQQQQQTIIQLYNFLTKHSHFHLTGNIFLLLRRPNFTQLYIPSLLTSRFDSFMSRIARKRLFNKYFIFYSVICHFHIISYYVDGSVLQGTETLVESIRPLHLELDGVFLYVTRHIEQLRHDSRLFKLC